MKQLGHYGYLVTFTLCALAVIWAECGYPRYHKIGDEWMLCAYDMPAHEIALRVLGVVK